MALWAVHCEENPPRTIWSTVFLAGLCALPESRDVLTLETRHAQLAARQPDLGGPRLPGIQHRSEWLMFKLEADGKWLLAASDVGLVFPIVFFSCKRPSIALNTPMQVM